MKASSSFRSPKHSSVSTSTAVYTKIWLFSSFSLVSSIAMSLLDSFLGFFRTFLSLCYILTGSDATLLMMYLNCPQCGVTTFWPIHGLSPQKSLVFLKKWLLLISLIPHLPCPSIFCSFNGRILLHPFYLFFVTILDMVSQTLSVWHSS